MCVHFHIKDVEKNKNYELKKIFMDESQSTPLPDLVFAPMQSLILESQPA